MKTTYHLHEIQALDIDLELPTIVFLDWDLWAWKTTLSQHIIKNLFWVSGDVTSPTYTYYNKYTSDVGDIYHFDLYRISDYEEFIHIWWEEILDNNAGLIIIEWSDILWDNYEPDIHIKISLTWNKDERQLQINKKGD